MTRVPPAASNGPVAQRMRERRGGTLSPLDNALLHSEAFADGWNALLGAVRGRMDLPGQLRELVICRIAAVNGAEYEWRAHAPLALKEGLDTEQVAALRAGADSAPLSELQRQVIDYTDAMTQDVIVPDPLSDALHERLGTRQLVELTGTIAAYNMVSRFLVALHVGLPRIEESEVPA